ncbi:hypothetical protein J3R82DRAFT_2731 [Butyriboletus roseoflavus]|nr:hypothetical protein J3R82DRAFT_2731 [Butyriboletus roseoflavus]
MKLAINSTTSKPELGLNHVQLAGYLCPVESVRAFNENAEEYILFHLLPLHNAHYSSINKTHKKLESEKIDMSATELPAFLWENNGTRYNEEDIYSGLFHRFYLERVARHIFTGPSTAHGGDSHVACSCNVVLHHMDKVEAVHITYAMVLAHFGISSQSHWLEKDSCFNYHKFYYIIQDMIDECEDSQVEGSIIETLQHAFLQERRWLVG